MNILDNSSTRLCTSCQMCAAICTKGAITINLDDEGFYRPSINNVLCINCGLCVKVCCKFETDVLDTDEIQLQNSILYAASAKDDKVVHSTTSGGIADLLAKQLISNGYKVIGVIYDSNKNCAIHKVVANYDDTNKFRGSKYIQSYCFEAFCKFVQEVRMEKFAIFGLPCQIYAISRYLDMIKKRDNCILIDLFCHGCPSLHVWTKVSDNLKKRLHTRSFQNVIWRSKYRGWGNFTLEAITEEGKHYVSRPMDNAFYDLYFCNQVLNESCTNCRLRSTLAYSDIRLGDFWGKDYSKTFRGMSGVSIVTKRGKMLFESILPNIFFTKKSYSTFLPWQSWSIEYNIDRKLRSTLLSRLSDPTTDLNYCIAPIAKRRSLKANMILWVKQILSYFPLGLEQSFRKIFQ